MNYSNLCYRCFREKPSPGKNCPYCGYNNSMPQMSINCLKTGSILKRRYIVGEALGVGGFGITYKCMDTKVGGICAIKEYFPTSFCTRMTGSTAVSVAERSREKYDKILTRFVEEAELLRTLHHRNIIRVLDSFFENNTAYYVMEYCDGIDLRSYTNQFTKKLNYSDGMNILYQTMNGMEYIHSKGILHRDIAPDNIFITKNSVVKLLDFGSARREMDQVNRNLSVIIKAGYAPVEQYGDNEKQGTYTDIYALGATFYHLFTGRMPLESTNRVSEQDGLIPISRLRPDLPDKLKYCIERCMSIRISDRIQTIQEMKRILGLQNVSVDPNGGGNGTDRPISSGNVPGRQSEGRLRIASFSERICAYMIDLIFYGVIYSGIILFAVNDRDIAFFVWLAFPIVFTLINMLSEALTYSTFGKMLMRLCVRNIHGGLPSAYSIVIRNIVKLSGVFNILFSNQQRMLDDRLTDSRVYSRK